MNEIHTIFALLVVYQTKHLVADYFLQGKYMLGKFDTTGWLGPLLAHTGVHGLATFMIALVFGLDPGIALMLGFLDMNFHFLIDKGKVEFSRGLFPKDKEFWWLLGVDQYAHHLTHYLLIVLIISELGLL